MASKSDVLEKHFGTRDYYEARKRRLEMMRDRRFLSPEKFTKMPIPYYAPGLPAGGIPSIEQIIEARETGRITHNRSLMSRRHIFKVGKFAVKFSADPIIYQEAENLLFLQENSKIRTPKLYAAFPAKGDPLGNISKEGYDEVPTYHYIVMDYIDGKTYTGQEWSTVDKQEQIKICKKIAEQLRLLRAVPPPNPPYYGRVHHQGWDPDFRVLVLEGLHYTKEAMLGPYNEYKDFIMALCNAAEYNAALSSTSKEYSPRVQLFLANLKESLGRFNDEDPRLTHLDLKIDNLIVQPDLKNPGDYSVVIIDWASLGWMPAWVEAAGLFTCGPAETPGDLELFIWELSQAFDPFYHCLAEYFQSCMCELGWDM